MIIKNDIATGLKFMLKKRKYLSQRDGEDMLKKIFKETKLKKDKKIWNFNFSNLLPIT